MTHRPLHILLIDDNDDDLMLMREALIGLDPQIRLGEALGGDAALAYLQVQPGIVDPARSDDLPDLVFLDINMPGLTGFDVLARIREHPTTRRLPVIMLTTSDHPDDVQRSYNLGANSFLTKPLAFENLGDLFRKVLAYWAGTEWTPGFPRLDMDSTM